MNVYLPVANGIVTANGRTYNLHGHPGSRFVYALGHRVYGTVRRIWSHERQAWVIDGFCPYGKWAFILAPQVAAEAELERA